MGEGALDRVECDPPKVVERPAEVSVHEVNSRIIDVLLSRRSSVLSVTQNRSPHEIVEILTL